MKYFKILLQLLPKIGVEGISNDREHFIVYSKKQSDFWFNEIIKCQNLVMINNNDSSIIHNLGEDDPNVFLKSAPFKYFSLEGFKSAINVIHDEDTGGVGYVYCICCIETIPNKWDFILLLEKGDIQKILHLKHEAYVKPINMMLDQIDKKSVHIVSTRDKIKINISGEKTNHFIKRYILISDKKYKIPEEIARVSKKVDWSHQWLVRGHWREIEGIGKDRNGDYCIENFTWVKDHKKGPEEKQLIRKTRIIKSWLGEKESNL